MEKDLLLIIESGATKADWCAVCADGSARTQVRTEGMNFATTSPQALQAVVDGALGLLQAQMPSFCGASVKQIHFYAAGLLTCGGTSVPESVQGLDTVFRTRFPAAETAYASDLLDAARAVCGHTGGIAAILGTGSNSCLYDGERIVKNVRSGGFILGDEGGGARLGRLFLSDFLKGLVPDALARPFAEAFKVDYMTVVQRVYREEAPSGYLGAFAPWIMARYGESQYVKELVDGNFRDFIERSLLQYDLASWPVGVVGGFGYAHRRVFLEVARPYGIRFSTFLPAPMEGLVAYHLGQQ